MHANEMHQHSSCSFVGLHGCGTTVRWYMGIEAGTDYGKLSNQHALIGMTVPTLITMYHRTVVPDHNLGKMHEHYLVPASFSELLLPSTAQNTSPRLVRYASHI